MEERVLVVVCLLLAVPALTGVVYQTSDISPEDAVTGFGVEGERDGPPDVHAPDYTVSSAEPSPNVGTETPLYVYAVAVVILLSIAAVIYHRRAAGVDKEANTQAEDNKPEGVTEEDTVDEQISDDERVLSMIESEEGKMKQKRVVEETGWSEAKVSKLTSRMEDDGMITKIRLGRENILEITGEEDGEEDDEVPSM